MAKKKLAQVGPTLRHYLYRVGGDLSDNARVQKAILSALDKAGATVIGCQRHDFTPHGTTVIAMLSESHASIHTWPEYGFAAMDYFTCAADPRASAFVEAFAAAGFKVERAEEIAR
jgi:S-adenosylmethionine decarboxylase proenzyme